MGSRIKELERNAKSYENRWRTAKDGNNVAETYKAAEDYKHNIEEQEKELKKLDPNSREYEKAERSIDEQKSKHWQMEYDQRREFSGQDMQRGMREIESKNRTLSQEMSHAENKCDVERYEQLRSQYEKNINAQEKMGREMRENGIDYNDTLCNAKTDLYDHDANMRDKLNGKNSEQLAKGKPVSEKDLANAEKYNEQVKKDLVEKTKWQGDRTIESMRERRASEEEIKRQEEENKESVESVKRQVY